MPQFKYFISDFDEVSIFVKRKQIISDYRLHWHDCCEVELVLSGRGTQILNGTEYPLRPGDLYMLTPADCHSIHISEPTTILGAMFEERYISSMLYERILTRESLGFDHIARLDTRRREDTEKLFEALCREHESNAKRESMELRELYVGNLLDCILINLLRSCSDDTRSIERSQMGAALLYLHGHYSEHITLGDVAEKVHLSTNYFSEVFKSVIGKNFKSYLTELRLRNACRMLANTDMQVTDVCFACGFESVSNFMRAFKRSEGMSPLRFRKKNKSEKMQ